MEVLFVLVYFAIPYVEGMDRNMNIRDENVDESASNSEGPSINLSGNEGSSERSLRILGFETSFDANLEECLQIGARLWISSRNRSARRLEGSPYTTSSPRRTDPLLPIGGRSSSPIAGISQASMPLLGFGNVAGIHRTTPFLVNVNKSSSETSDHSGSLLLPRFTVPTSSSGPNLFLRQEQKVMLPSSDSKDIPQQPLLDCPFRAMSEQFRKLGVSTEQSSKLCSIQPLNLACADSIEGQSSPMASTSLSLPQLGPSVQASGLAATSDDFKSIVKTALNLIGHIIKALTNRRSLPIPLGNITNSLVALLENVAFAFKTIERHPDSDRLFDRIGVSQFTRIFMRITDVTADVRHAIERHRAGQNFDLGDRLESILVEDLNIWCGVLEQILNGT